MADTTINVDTASVGMRILADLKERLGAQWDALADQQKSDIAWVCGRYGVILIMHAVGMDVTEKLADTQAFIDNWGWVGADTVAEAALLSAKKVAGVIGELIAAVAIGAAKKAIG